MSFHQFITYIILLYYIIKYNNSDNFNDCNMVEGNGGFRAPLIFSIYIINYHYL